MPDDWNHFALMFGVGSKDRRVDAYLRYIEGLMAKLVVADTALKDVTLPEADLLRLGLAKLRLDIRGMHETLKTDRSPATLQELLERLPVGARQAEGLLEDVRALALRDDVPLNMARSAAARAMLDEVFQKNDVRFPSPEQEDAMRRALIRRFGLDPQTGLEGEWSSKSVSSLYKLLGKLPERHVLDNDFIRHFENDTSQTQTRGLLGVHNKGAARVVLFNLQAGVLRKPYPLEQDDVDDPAIGILSRKRNTFTHVTLHEVGHAVDHKIQFSDPLVTGGGHPAGWRSHSRREVAAALLPGTGGGASLTAAFPTVPQRHWLELLDDLLNGEAADAAIDKMSRLLRSRRDQAQRRPTLDALKRLKCMTDAYERTRAPLPDFRSRQLTSNHTLITSVSGDLKDAVGELWFQECAELVQGILDTLDITDKETFDEAWMEVVATNPLANLAGHPGYANSVDPDWGAVAVHPTIAQAAFIGADHETFWNRGNAAAERATVQGRVYFFSANGGWFSYDARARRAKVSNYQFNAPPEWFAELYAVYQQEVLPDSHPHYRLLEHALQP